MIDLLFAAILIGELIGFYVFYKTENGCEAIYHAWYAPVIDILGIVSGSIIMLIALFAKNNPALFNFDISLSFIFLLFIMGSWQTSIHAVKGFLRLTNT